jgi:transglutaminase-like putative cysteine protease
METKMQRRDFMKALTLGATVLNIPVLTYAKSSLKDLVQKTMNPRKSNPKINEPWKTVEVTTQVNTSSDGPTQIWLPVPQVETLYQELISTEWNGNFLKAGLAKDKKYSAQVFYANWDKSDKIELNVIYKVRVKNRSEVGPVNSAIDNDAITQLYLQPTSHVPLDGIVKETALKITKSETNTDKKAKMIYNWICESTARDPKIVGCGLGDVKTLLMSGNLVGKCADLSSLFVGLCRAVGIPAREVFGLRVLASEISKSTGKTGDVTKGQHCRAEYYSNNKGWVPVDPADVLKIILEENLNIKETRVTDIREKLFGFWEMNWIAYNSARDCALPPNYTEDINYMMYPRLVSQKMHKDGIDPDHFKYIITAKEIS